MTAHQEAERTLSLQQASKIKSVRPKWLWTGRVPSGTITMFGGRGGEGKSTFALYLAALLNAGKLEGDQFGRSRSVLIISHEDDWGTVMVPRLKAAGADLDLVYRMGVETRVDEVTSETVPAFPLDVDKLREGIEQTDAKLVIIDPIPSTIGGDLHKVADVRRALDPLAAIAQELDIAIIGVMHFNKGAGNASDKLSGSHAFRDAVRSVMLFATDDETGQRVVTVDKSNYSTARGDSFAFNLVSETVHTDDGEHTEVGRVEYLGDTDLTVEQIINRLPDGEGQSESADAAAWLYDYLLSKGGSVAKKDVDRAARAEGYSEKVLRRARERANVETSRSGFPSTTIWSLGTPVTPTGAQSRPVSGVGTTGPEWAPLEGMTQ